MQGIRIASTKAVFLRIIVGYTVDLQLNLKRCARIGFNLDEWKRDRFKLGYNIVVKYIFTSLGSVNGCLCENNSNATYDIKFAVNIYLFMFI